MSAQLFLTGAAAMACFAIGLVFLRYWKVSRDRFFLWFAAAFWIFMIGWTLRLISPQVPEHTHFLYLPRLLGFVMIVIAIVMKNRRPAD